MQDQLASLAYGGKWSALLDLLTDKPHLANAASSGKGYTPLHQAAWHGAELAVIGALLALGADRRLPTREGMTACDIARSRHPDREDLHYILTPSTRTLAQLLRKLIAERPELFSDYDGNRLICDRLIACLGENWVEFDVEAPRDASGILLHVDARVGAALHAVTGLPLPPGSKAYFTPAANFDFAAGADFLRRTLLPLLRDLALRAGSIPLERHWATLGDLFEPSPDQWGLRGDLFLWMEMRQALCHCELAEASDQGKVSAVENRLAAAFVALTGAQLDQPQHVQVRRYARGGMSGGMVSSEYWRSTAIPLLARQADWLRQSWGSSA